MPVRVMVCQLQPRHSSATYHGGMATGGVPSNDAGLSELFAGSPDLQVHTSAAAEAGLLLGLFALLAAPFSLMQTLSLGTASVAAVLAFVGVATTSRPNVAGSALAPLGLAFSLVALILVGLRYLGVDTAFGDELIPVLGEWLAGLNERLPQP
jgi:hypothetical protein